MTDYPNRPGMAGGPTPAINRPLDQPQYTAGQAQRAAGQIADNVRGTARQAMGQSAGSFDLNAQVAQRPWLALGAAVAAGYLLSNLGGSGRRQERRYSQPAVRPYDGGPFAYGQDPRAAAIQQAQQYESAQREGMVGALGRRWLSKLASLEDLFHEQLQDLYDAEHQILKALPKMIEAASSNELRRAFELHLQQTRNQIQRLQQVFQQLGSSAQGKTCAAMRGLITEGQELMSMRADPAVMDAGLIAAAQRVEHYEIAGYGCLRTWARQLGYTQVVHLLQQTLEEEEQTDRQLTHIAEQAINVKAAQG